VITAVTPNPALDVTYLVPDFRLHGTVRVRSVAERPGGKGVNVARIVDAYDRPVEVTGLLGGPDGQRVADLLTASSPRIRQNWCPISGRTRRTVTLVDGSDATMIGEPGPVVTSADWQRLADWISDGSAGSGGSDAGDDHAGPVTISGSLPVGSTPEDLARLVDVCRAQSRLVVVDASGPALLAAARHGADLVKPNRQELMDATGAASPAEGAGMLLDQGCRAVVVSAGPDGLQLFLKSRPGRVYIARPSRQLAGNPTGAGDATVASFAMALNDITHVDDADEAIMAVLPRAVAMSAAAVLAPVAGEVDKGVCDQEYAGVRTEEEEI
jgi:1-phosphofructokinase family hexose kinase